MSIESSPDHSPSFSLQEAALRLDVNEPTLREWLSTFQWERRYDGEGHLYLNQRDLAFLRVVKSLKEVDRSCESIVRIITQEEIQGFAAPEAEEAEVEAPPEADPSAGGLAQIESLKAELKELHARPAKKPFWKFW